MLPLSHILNKCFEQGIFPDQLKIARVCPIFKSGLVTDISNYRPISILNSFSKIFEKAIYNRLVTYIEKYNVISQCQFGFRKNYSTSMALLNLYDYISKAIDKGQYCMGVFIDLSKAFDTINHNILLEKLNIYGIRGLPNDTIRDYLCNRKQYVLLNNCKSQMLPLTVGVPQGSILGPLLFLLYINDIVDCCSHLNFILFADDTNILYANDNLITLIKIINTELSKLSDWFKANWLSLNLAKTSYMTFGYKNYSVSKCVSSDDSGQIFHLNLKIDDTVIDKVETTKFLGVMIDPKFLWHNHISYLSAKIAKSLYILSRIRFKLSRKYLIQLYHSLIYPHLNYCNILWGNASSTALNHLKILQKRALRLINRTSYLEHTDPLFSQSGILPLADINTYCTALFLFKYIHNFLPESCAKLLIRKHYDNDSYFIRVNSIFSIPPFRTVLRERSITIRGPQIWKMLPDKITNCTSIGCFKSNLKLTLLCM